MDSLTDVELNGTGFLLVPGGYERAAETAIRPEPSRQQLASFGLGLGIVQDDEIEGDQGGGWTGDNVRAIGGGTGLEPWPLIVPHTDAALVDLPSTTQRPHELSIGSHTYVGIGQRIYRSVALTRGSWANLTVDEDLGAGFAISGLAYLEQDIIAVLLGSGQDIREYDIGTSAVSTLSAFQKGVVGIGHNGALLYYPGPLPNGRDVVRVGFVHLFGAWAIQDLNVDNPIVSMARSDSGVVVATKTGLHMIAGQLRSAAAGTEDAPTWSGEPEAIMTIGQIGSGSDFVFVTAYKGLIYTWVAGQILEVAETGGVARPVGPNGRACFGGCIAGAYLLVAIETLAGAAELWAFDGAGWWRIATGAAGSLIWPIALAGAGGYDAIVFAAGSNVYNLIRLEPRSDTDPAYAAAAEWVSPLLTGGDAGTDTAWRAIDVWFTWPDVSGNPASADTVAIALDYSINAGANWTEIDADTVSVGREFHLGHTFPAPPASRTLQVRVRWASVVDWAPVLTHVDVDFAPIDTSPRRQQWTIGVRVPDQLPGSGRVQIDALWEAWGEQTSVAFRDIDYDTNPVERQVRVLDIRETAPQPRNDAGDWSGGVVTLALAEL